jgi:hypothetical protein
VKVYAYPSDAWGCGHYRIIWPARAVAEPGVDVEVVPPGTRSVEIPVGPTGQVQGEGFPRDADVVVFQRPTHRFVVQTMRLLQARGVAVVVEIDDDLGHIHPSNPAWAMLQPRVRHGNQVGENLNTAANFVEALRVADLVVVSTDELAARYGQDGRVRVLRNCVPAAYLAVDPGDRAGVGWGGSLHSHPDDLQQVGTAVANMVAAGVGFRHVGDPAGVARALGLRGVFESVGNVALSDYPAAIARFAVGIAPLAATRFNRCKSWLKPLEYSAVGVPWVASPLPEYMRLAELGVGVLAGRPREWQAVLRLLLADERARAEQASAGRDVAAGLTVEGNAWRWAEAWADAVQVRRSGRIAARRVGVAGARGGSLASRARPRSIRA